VHARVGRPLLYENARVEQQQQEQQGQQEWEEQQEEQDEKKREKEDEGEMCMRGSGAPYCMKMHV
jgi:hypothetical protein